MSIDQKKLEEKKKEITDLKKVLKTDAYKEIVNEGINLDTEITILEEKSNNLKKSLKIFKYIQSIKISKLRQVAMLSKFQI